MKKPNKSIHNNVIMLCVLVCHTIIEFKKNIHSENHYFTGDKQLYYNHRNMR